jgi:hypothetical protein
MNFPPPWLTLGRRLLFYFSFAYFQHPATIRLCPLVVTQPSLQCVRCLWHWRLALLCNKQFSPPLHHKSSRQRLDLFFTGGKPMPPPSAICYFACRTGGELPRYPWFVAVATTQSTCLVAPQILYHLHDYYHSCPQGEYHGIQGRWIAPYLFVPPLALFTTPREAQAMLTLELATSF